MKNIKLAVFGILAMAVTLMGCSRAEAVDFSVGYQDNTVIDKEGVAASVGGEYNNLRLGVNTFTTSDKLESYGVYGKLPIYIQGTRFTVTPQAQVDHYRDADEVVGGLGIGGEFALTDTLRLEAVAMAHKGFDNKDFKGETYTVGLTKTF